MSKNLLERSLEYTWYNINPYIQGVNLNLQQYEYYLQQEMIAKALTYFLNNNGFTVKKENDYLIVQKNSNTTPYEFYKKEENNEV